MHTRSLKTVKEITKIEKERSGLNNQLHCDKDFLILNFMGEAVNIIIERSSLLSLCGLTLGAWGAPRELGIIRHTFI